MTDRLVSYFRSSDALRSRSVSSVVLSGMAHVPMLPTRLVADWHRDVSLERATGEVEVLSLPRARVRWPDYPHCVQAARDWTGTLGLQALLADCDVALMACCGAKYHHDGGQYGGMAFCNFFLSEDRGLDLHFPFTGHRIPLRRGLLVLFDTAQPHGVVARGSSGFNAADFASGQDASQVFLTWELPIENFDVAQALGLAFDVGFSAPLMGDEEQVWLGDARVSVCPTSGRWHPYD